MKIKKYMAPSMREALLMIKRELGEEAIILKSRKLPRKLLSLHAHNEIEVTAAVDDSFAPSPVAPLRVSEPGIYQRSGKKAATGVSIPVVPEAAPDDNHRAAAPWAVTAPRKEETGDKLRYLEIKEDLRELKDLLKSILQTGETTAAGGFEGGWAVLYKRLIDSEVKPEIARELIRSIREKRETLDSANEKDLVALLGEYFPVSGPIRLVNDRPLVIVFVGPTGVGKTTSLAKLAAHLAVNRGKLVSLITADTYRIAAIEQIRAFADIVNIGLQVIFTPDEVEEAVGACENDDIVFVDTAGRSQNNRDHMKDLSGLLSRLHPDEVHLVLSATTKDSDLIDIIERYNNLGINRLLFTKLDETRRLGNVFNAVRTSGIPVSYFTVGQSIPDDIELAQAGRFVQRLWEGRHV